MNFSFFKIKGFTQTITIIPNKIRNEKRNGGNSYDVQKAKNKSFVKVC